VPLHPIAADLDLELSLLDVPGGPLAVLRDAPEVRSRATVLLVPGLTGSKEDFRLIAAPLVEAGHPVVLLDQRGQHQSPGPDDPAAYTVEVLARDLLAAVDELRDGPVHLVGHSFGGLVSRAAVLQRPEAFRSLTLMCSGPAGLTGPRTAILGPLREVAAVGITTVVEVMDQLNAVDEKFLLLDASFQGFLRDRMLASSAAGLIGMSHAIEGEPDRVEQLRATGLPVLVLHGEDDDAWSPAAQADMAERLGAAYAVVPDAVHSPAVEQPEATAKALLAFFPEPESEL
jgi:pimeloyl-ACP methyl ester carboxylesterase